MQKKEGVEAVTHRVSESNQGCDRGSTGVQGRVNRLKTRVGGKSGGGAVGAWLIYGFIGEGQLGEVLRIRGQVLARRRLGQTVPCESVFNPRFSTRDSGAFV
jgi:hypothetical protein